MPIGKKGIRRIALYGTALILAAVLISPFVLPSLINSHAVRERITREIYTATGINLPPDNVRVALSPFPGIRIRQIPLELGRGFSVMVETLTIDLNLATLLDRKISVDRIRIQNPFIRYTPQAPPASPPEKEKPGQRQAAAALPLSIPRGVLDTVYDLLPHSQDDIVIDATGIRSDYFDSMALKILVFKEKKQMVIQTGIRGLDINQKNIGPVLPRLSLPAERVQVPETTLVLRLDNEGGLSGKLGIKGAAVKTSRIRNALSAASLSLDFSLAPDHSRARLHPARISYPAAEVGVDYTQNLETGKTGITFTGKAVNISQAREVCLPLLSGIEVSDQLFDILRGGTAKTVSVGFEADSPDTLFDAENLVIQGEAAGARVRIPETPLVAEKVSAMASMKDGVLHIEPGGGVVAGTAIRDGVLDIDLIQDKGVPFSGTFDLDARLDRLPETLISLLPGTDLAREMEKVTSVTGTARATLGLAMPRGQNHLAVTVTAGQIQASAAYERIPLPLQIDNGNFHLKGSTIKLDGLSGTLGTSPVRDISALIDLEAEPQLTLTSASADLALEELMPWASSHPDVMALLSPVKKISGNLVLDSLTVSGPMFDPRAWAFFATGSGRDMDIGLSTRAHSFESVSGQFEFSRNRFSVTGINARVMDLGWLDFAFDQETLSSIRLPIDITESRVDRSDQIFVHGKLQIPAGVEASFDLKGQSPDHLHPTLITLQDPGMTDLLLIPYTDPEKPKFSFDGLLDTRTLQKALVTGSVLHRSLEELTGGNPLTVFTDHNSHLHLETAKLNLDALLSPEKKDRQTDSSGAAPSPPEESSRPLLAQKSLGFKTGELVYLNRTFTDVGAQVHFDAGATRVIIQQADLCGLSGTGQVDITHGSTPPEVSTTFSLNALNETNIAGVMSCLFKTDSVIDGGYSFSMAIDGRGNADTVARKQQGSLAFKSRQGRIYKATILSRVLSVINILDVDIRQKGFAYKSFVVEADIEDSVLKLNKVYIDAENMAVIGSGWLDPLNDKMDITFLVAPFKTIDTIIKHIPIVNTLLSGRLISLPARASGSISDPSVVPLSPSAVGKGLVNMLTDLVKTPVRLFEDEAAP